MKVLPRLFQQCLASVDTLTLERCSKTASFGDSSNHISRSQELRRCLGYEADLFFQNALYFMQITKME